MLFMLFFAVALFGSVFGFLFAIRDHRDGHGDLAIGCLFVSAVYWFLLGNIYGKYREVYSRKGHEEYRECVTNMPATPHDSVRVYKYNEENEDRDIN